jgi:multiple sugar transport system substrate-binding protein
MTTWGFGFEQRAPEIKSKVAVLPPMTGPHGDKGTQVWINSLMCYKSTKHPAETKTFLKWWSKNVKELWTVGHCGVLPARKSIGADAYFQDDEFAKPILNDWVPLGQRLGAKVGGTFPLLGRIDGSDFLSVLASDILQGADVKASLQKAADALETLKK